MLSEFSEELLNRGENVVTLCLLVAFRFSPTQQPLLETPLPSWFYFPFNQSVISRIWQGVDCLWGAEISGALLVWYTSTFVCRHQRWCHPGAGSGIGWLPATAGRTEGAGEGMTLSLCLAHTPRRWYRRSFAWLGSLLSSGGGKETAPTCWKTENGLLFALAELVGNSSRSV